MSLVKEYVKSWADTTMLDVFTAEVPEWSKNGLILLPVTTPRESRYLTSPLLEITNLLTEFLISCLKWLNHHE